MLIDAHSHLQLSEYDADRAEVIARMIMAGVKTITVGVDNKTSEQALALVREYPECMWAAVGTHPADLPTGQAGGGLDAFDAAALRVQAAHKEAVAIGECGLDYYRLKGEGMEAIKAKQKEVFLEQVRIAEEVGKPLMIHCRPTKGTDDAYEDLAAIFDGRRPGVPVVVHFFVGSPAIARRLVAHGCYFTFGGAITFARDYDEAISLIPEDRIMAETDAPFVAPVPHRGKRNEPAFVGEVVRRLSELWGIGFDEAAAKTAGTARRIFGI